MNTITVDVYPSVDAKLRSAWQNLWLTSENGHFFNSPNWFEACMEALQYPDCKIYAAWEGDVLVGICPLVRSKKYGVEIWGFAGGNNFSRSALLFSDKERQSLGMMIDTMRSAGSLYLNELDEASREYPEPAVSGMILQRCSQSRYLPLTEPFKYTSGQNKNRVLNRIKKSEGTFVMKEYPANIPAHLAKAYAIEQGSYKHARQKEAFASEQDRRFFETVARHHEGKVVVCCMEHEGRAVAYELQFLDRKTVFNIQKSFVVDYAKLSIGKVLVYNVLSHYQEQGYETYDFGRGDDRLKADFTPFLLENVEVFIAGTKLHYLWFKTVGGIETFLESHPRLYDLARKIKNLL